MKLGASFEMCGSDISVLENSELTSIHPQKRSFKEMYEDFDSPAGDYTDCFDNLIDDDDLDILSKRFRFDDDEDEEEFDHRNHRTTLGVCLYSHKSGKFETKNLEFSMLFGNEDVVDIYHCNMRRLAECIKSGRKWYWMLSPFYEMGSIIDRRKFVKEYSLLYNTTRKSKFKMYVREIEHDDKKQYEDLRKWELSFKNGSQTIKCHVSSFISNGKLKCVHRSTRSNDNGIGDFMFRHVHGCTDKISLCSRLKLILNHSVFIGMKQFMFNILFDNKKKVTFFFKLDKLENMYKAYAFLPSEEKTAEEIALVAVTKFLYENRKVNIPTTVDVIETEVIRSVREKMANYDHIPKVKDIMVFSSSYGPVIHVCYD